MIIYSTCVYVCVRTRKAEGGKRRGKDWEWEALDCEVPGRVPCLLGFLDPLTDYVNYGECVVGRTYRGFNKNNL